MTTKLQQVRRALLLLGLVLLAFLGLGFRLVDLQIWRHDELSARAEQNTQRRYWEEARRGDILDANGNLLATSVPAETVCANPYLIGDQPALVAHALAPLLQMDENDLAQRLQMRVYRNSRGELFTNRYVVVQRKVPEDTWQKIRATMTNLLANVDESSMSRAERTRFYNYRFGLQHYAVFGEPDQLRVYPNGSLAAHVLGFVGTRQTTNNTSQLFGYDGIERFFDGKLSGASGWRVTGVDSHKNELIQLRDQDVGARDGLNVQLTIDAAIQHIVEEALATSYREHSPQNITGIVVRPRTGEILAMASLPNFDPNNLETITTNNEANVCISRLYEPGSTFKTIVISGALNEHVVSLNDTVFCENGAFHYGGITLHDAEHDHFGLLTVQQVLQKSSNIGASKIGIKMGPEKLFDYMTDFGLGAFTGIPLPGELSARQFVRPPRDINGHSNWGKYSIAQIPMGQGVAVTRLQMTMAVAAIANGGVLMRPMLVKDLQDHDGDVVERYEPQAVRRVVTAETAREMVEALKTVVTPDGTAPKAALTNYTVAGKTGTAQKVINGAYASDRFVVTFIGFFPADHPEVCISVVMDAPKEGGHAFGGALCGPVFHEIAERCASYLNIPPDINLPPAGAPQIVSTESTR